MPTNMKDNHMRIVKAGHYDVFISEVLSFLIMRQ